MSDPGGQPASRPPEPHTATYQWHSFEVRMRQRRAERCLLRADVALDEGFPDAAQAAVDEARQLDADSTAIAAIEQRIAQATSSLPAAAPAYRRMAVIAAMACVVAIFAVAIAGRPASRLAVTPSPDAVQAPSAAADQPSPTGTTGEALSSSVQMQTTLVTVPVTMRPEPPEPNPRDAAPAATSRPDATVGREERVEPPPLPAVAAVPPPPPPAAPGVNAIATLPSGSVSLPVPAAPPSPANEDAARAPERAPAPDQSAAVRATLARYEAAYSSLNASAAHAVWPAVDERALARAFDGLESQRVSLGDCDVSLNGPLARATCAGSAAWTPKVGGGGARTSARRWSFDLKNAGGAWQIVRADAR